MEETSVCRHCGRTVSTANLLVHEARCGRMPPATSAAAPQSSIPQGSPSSSSSSSSSVRAAHVPTAMAAPTPSSSTNVQSGDSATMVMEEEEDNWACNVCTCLNPESRTVCGACDTPRGASAPLHMPQALAEEDFVRPPDQSYTDCLINDSNFYTGATAPPPPQRPQRSSSFGPLLAGAAMGALGGGLLSYLRGGSVADGAISGAGYGALGTALWNEFAGGPGPDEVFRGRPATGPTSYSRTIVTPTGRRTVRVYSSSGSGAGGSGAGGATAGMPVGMPPDFFDDVMFPFHRRMGPAQRQLELMLLRSLAAQHGHGLDVDNMSYEELLQRFGDRRPRPATSQIIHALPTRTITEADVRRTQESASAAGSDSSAGDSRASCLVCLENFNVGDEVKTLPCLHMFHTACIDEWLTNSGVCPVCKFRVDEQQAEHNQAA